MDRHILTTNCSFMLQKSFDFFHYGRAKDIKDSYAVRLSKYYITFKNCSSTSASNGSLIE